MNGISPLLSKLESVRGEVSIDDLVLTISSNYKDKAGEKLLKAAYDYAKLAHEGQDRMSGDSYFSHPTQVANILANTRYDYTTVTIALLHDVVDQTGNHDLLDEINENFGWEISNSVSALTGFDAYFEEGPNNALEKNMWKRDMLSEFFTQSIEVPRIAAVKMADRINNLMTFGEYKKPLQKERIWNETNNYLLPRYEKTAPLLRGLMKQLLEKHKPEPHFLSKLDSAEKFLDYDSPRMELIKLSEFWDMTLANLQDYALENLKYADPKKIRAAFPNAEKRAGRFTWDTKSFLKHGNPSIISNYRNDLKRLARLDYVSRNFLDSTIRGALATGRMSALQVRLNAILPNAEKKDTALDYAEIATNQFGHEIMVYNVNVDTFSKQEYQKLLKDMDLEEPYLVRRNDHPNFKLMIPATKRPWAGSYKNLDFPFVIVNVYEGKSNV